ncbi:MAG: hypothetical protein ACJAYL_001034 [Cryomorphaceae bacterium]|jgi:hypothetical protein
MVAVEPSKVETQTIQVTCLSKKKFRTCDTNNNLFDEKAFTRFRLHFLSHFGI